MKEIAKPNVQLTLLGAKCDGKDRKVDYFVAKVEIECLAFLGDSYTKSTML